MSQLRRAFSMIEVLLALGILSFAVLMILALLPAGLQTNQDTQEESVAVNIVNSIVADWRSVGTTTNKTPLFALPSPSRSMATSGLLGIGDGGQATNVDSARYRVAYDVSPPAASSFSPYYVHFTVSWPAQAAIPLGKIEFVSSLPSR